MSRGLDFSRNYRVRFENSGQVLHVPRATSRETGISVRLEDNLTSELLILEAESSTR